MNQHLNDGALFASPVGQPITELRKAGDQVILYTEDHEINKRFKDWKNLIQRVPYLQARSLIGVDLYFPKSELKGLLRSLRQFYSRPLVERGSSR